MAAEKLVIGLGNPGREYEKTRHNLGFLVAMRLAKEYGAEFKKFRQANALVAEIKEGDARIFLVLPLTYMNNSGIAVRDIAHFEKILPENILVVCDDINLDFGEARLKAEALKMAASLRVPDFNGAAGKIIRHINRGFDAALPAPADEGHKSPFPGAGAGPASDGA